MYFSLSKKNSKKVYLPMICNLAQAVLKDIQLKLSTVEYGTTASFYNDLENVRIRHLQKQYQHELDGLADQCIRRQESRVTDDCYP